jgi:hypothetical protein
VDEAGEDLDIACHDGIVNVNLRARSMLGSARAGSPSRTSLSDEARWTLIACVEFLP